MAPGKWDLTIYQGDDVSQPFKFQTEAGAPINLTGTTFAAQIRHTTADADETGGTTGPPIATFTVVNTDLVGGIITLTLAHTITENLPTSPPSTWDLQGTKAGLITTYLAGAVTITPEVTRP